MASNRPFSFGPVALSTTLTTNILNPPTTTGGVNAGAPPSFILLRHLRIVNKTNVAATVSLWVGASAGNAAGTEFAWQAKSVPANDAVDWTGAFRMGTADFLVGGAGTATALSIAGEGEIGLA